MTPARFSSNVTLSGGPHDGMEMRVYTGTETVALKEWTAPNTMFADCRDHIYARPARGNPWIFEYQGPSEWRNRRIMQPLMDFIDKEFA